MAHAVEDFEWATEGVSLHNAVRESRADRVLCLETLRSPDREANFVTRASIATPSASAACELLCLWSRGVCQRNCTQSRSNVQVLASKRQSDWNRCACHRRSRRVTQRPPLDGTAVAQQRAHREGAASEARLDTLRASRSERIERSERQPYYSSFTIL